MFKMCDISKKNCLIITKYKIALNQFVPPNIVSYTREIYQI